MEWTGGVRGSIRAELDKEKLGGDLVATVCVHTSCVCGCVWVCIGL